MSGLRPEPPSVHVRDTDTGKQDRDSDNRPHDTYIAMTTEDQQDPKQQPGECEDRHGYVQGQKPGEIRGHRRQREKQQRSCCPSDWCGY